MDRVSLCVEMIWESTKIARQQLYSIRMSESANSKRIEDAKKKAEGRQRKVELVEFLQESDRWIGSLLELVVTMVLNVKAYHEIKELKLGNVEWKASLSKF